MLNHYKTIIVSDVHLGTEGKNLKKLIYFLKKNTCEKLILNGDLIKGWQLRKIKRLHKHQANFLNALFKLIEKYDTEIIFLTGKNEVVPNNKSLKFGKISFQEELVITSGNSKYFLTSEDIISKYILNDWMTKASSLPYIFAVWINRKYNEFRFNHGKAYFSLLKGSPLYKKCENLFLKNLRTFLLDLSIKKDCDGIICGHIHVPCMLQIGGINYFNTGYWSESNQALVESAYGDWGLAGYTETLKADKEARKHYKIQKKLFQKEQDEAIMVTI